MPPSFSGASRKRRSWGSLHHQQRGKGTETSAARCRQLAFNQNTNPLRPSRFEFELIDKEDQRAANEPYTTNNRWRLPKTTLSFAPAVHLISVQARNRSAHDLSSSPYPVRCTIEGMKIPPEVRAAMTEIARMFGRQGGKTSARNMTSEERSARAKKASLVAAEQRTAKRLAREGLKRDGRAAKRKRSGTAR